MSRAAAFRIWSRVAAPLVLLVSDTTAAAPAIVETPHEFTDQSVQKYSRADPRCQIPEDSPYLSSTWIKTQQLEEIRGEVVELGAAREAPEQTLDALPQGDVNRLPPQGFDARLRLRADPGIGQAQGNEVGRH